MQLISGSRGSRLAVRQTELVAELLRQAYPEIHIEIKKITTKGDRILDAPFAKIGGKGLFVKEIEESLLRGEIDFAVHSLKDVPVELPDDLHLVSFIKRDKPNDAFVSMEYSCLEELPFSAVAGTSSLRRICQLKNMRPDIIVRNLRGNVDTRLRKLSEGEFDGIIIAAAGLIRLGLQEKITRLFSTEEMTPAAGQGIITVECRKNHEDINKLMAAINDKDSEICSIAERTFLGRLGGGCQIPTGSHCFSECEGNLKMTGIIGTPDGMKIIRETGFGKDPVELGNRLAEKILAEGGKDILNGCQ